MVCVVPPGGVNVTVAPVIKLEPAIVTLAELYAGVVFGVTEAIDGVGGEIRNVRVTGVATAKFALPVCVAVMEQVPGATSVTILAATVQMPVEFDV